MIQTKHNFPMYYLYLFTEGQILARLRCARWTLLPHCGTNLFMGR